MRQPEKNQRSKRPPLSCIKVQPILLDTSKLPPKEFTEFEKAQRQLFEWFQSKEEVHDIIDDLFFQWQMKNNAEEGIYSQNYVIDVLHVYNYLQKFIRLLEMVPPPTKQDFLTY